MRARVTFLRIKGEVLLVKDRKKLEGEFTFAEEGGAQGWVASLYAGIEPTKVLFRAYLTRVDLTGVMSISGLEGNPEGGQGPLFMQEWQVENITTALSKSPESPAEKSVKSKILKPLDPMEVPVPIQ
jgi:hypothetical protein